MALQKQKKRKPPDRRPARSRYWAQRRLEKRKVRRLMRQLGISRLDAQELWRNQRRGRVAFPLSKTNES